MYLSTITYESTSIIEAIMNSPSVRVLDTKYEGTDKDPTYDADFEEQYNKTKYKWDDFQLHAFSAIREGRDVLVSAPTSSGKSHVGWYALKQHLFNNDSKRHRIIYTSPIKTLSNEKFEEMTEYLADYGIRPGLLTGDHRVNVDSDFLIVTAEILSNALFRLKGIEDKKNDFELDTEFVNSISCVIMDEIHFISDASRGHVWENTIVLLERDVQLIGLSATIDQPQRFAEWIARTRERPISLVMKYERPVPLEYGVYDGSKVKIVMTKDGTYQNDIWLESARAVKEHEDHHSSKRTDKRLDMLRSFIRYADRKELMQLCFIIFSKRNCERFAEQVDFSLLTSRESTLAVRELETKLGTHLQTQSTIPRYNQIKRLVQKGICFHHAGMPVILKEVVEHLYKTGHVKVLFATETVAIGVNMPVRTIVFTSLEKSSGQSENGQGSSIRYINSAEFKQICGRAGRRGIDTRGTVVFLPIYSMPDQRTVKDTLLFGPMPKIESKLQLTYHSYLRTEISDVLTQDGYFDKSLLKTHTQSVATGITRELETVREKLSNLSTLVDSLKKGVPYQDYKSIMEHLRNQSQSSQYGFAVKLTSKQRKNSDRLRRICDKNAELTKAIQDLMELRTEESKTLDQLEHYTEFKDNRYARIREFLRITEYLDPDYKITDYGVMVAHINECNPFILAEIFTGNIIQCLTTSEIVGLCAVLVDPISSMKKVDKTVSSIESINIREAISYLETRVDAYRTVERDVGLEDGESDEYWRISLDYVEIAQQWASADPEKDTGRILGMLEEMEEYEGTFIKNMLKIDTIISNLIMLAKLTNDMTLVPKLEEIIIVKGMVNTDSLHVNI